jgi:hypothetical protein
MLALDGVYAAREDVDIFVDVKASDFNTLGEKLFRFVDASEEDPDFDVKPLISGSGYNDTRS